MDHKKTLVIVVHPCIDKSAANKRWMEELAKYQNNFDIHALYDEYPDEKIDIRREQQLIEQYDNIVFQFPLYWYSSPHLLKKWLDEVFTYGWAYGNTGGKLKGKNFALAISLGGSEDYYSNKNGSFTLNQVLSPLEATFKFVQGNYHGYHTMFSVTSNTTDEELAENAKKYVSFLTSIK